ncbi:MAG: EVE domain-containing protein [Verrucomicrobia bacterium]|jgi:predicted RNA-binding protein with PUA-like domain|nr:EVE domain-containing protein [Verrucomicrobiota bacterium]NBS86629.1 EVE domain-containing protein [Verrucomicrobiota bacterium]
MNYWLVKQEPSKYPFSLFLKEKKTIWDGVRNYQARNFLRAMQAGDQVLYYHSVDEKAVVGVAQVLKTAFPDPTSPTGEDWSSVLLGATRALSKPVTLDQLKANKKFEELLLLRQSRLSVMPVPAPLFQAILKMGS